MAVRTVTVDLRLDTNGYTTIGRSVVQANRGMERSMNDLAMAANAASIQAEHMGRNLRQMGNRARLAERRVRELRQEIDHLIASQAIYNQLPNPFRPGAGLAQGAGGRGGGMLGMLATPMGVAAATAVAAATPFIASALGGLLLTVLGGGAIAVGIAAGIKDAKVKDAFGQFGEFVGEEFKTYGEAFDVPLIAAADHFHDRFASISPKIRSTLAEMAAGVRPLYEGITGFIEKAGPGIKSGLLASLQVLSAFSAQLPELGESIGDFFDLVGSGSEGAADGIVQLMRAIGWTLEYLGTYIGLYETMWAAVGDAPDVLRAALGGIPFMEFTEGATSAIIPLTGLGYQANDTASAFEHLTQSLSALTQGFNDQWGAAIAYEEAIDNLAESVKENGRSMDIGTEKGRANSLALKAVFEAAERTYEANIKSGMSAQEAAGKYNAQIEAARAAAIAAGMAADEVNRLAAAQRALPTGVKTLVYNVVTKFRTEGSPNYNRTPGNQVAFRDGGVTYARDGLMTLGGTSGIASGGRPLIGFAEPGTGGEAFIARNAPQSRSLAIANTAAGWHGGQVVPKSWTGGGVTTVSLSIAPGAGFAGDPMVGAVIGMFRDRKVVLRDSTGQPVRLAGA